VASIGRIRSGLRRFATSRVGGPLRASILCAALTAASALSAAVTPVTASAATGHAYLSQTTGSPLSNVSAVAADKTGDVFVADPASGEIDVYAAGKLANHFQAAAAGDELPAIAVDAGGRVYVVVREGLESQVVVFKPFGGTYVPLAEWTGANATGGGTFSGEVSGVAVDNSGGSSAGDVYVADQGENAVYGFKPQAENGKEPEFIAALKGKPKFETPSAVAVSPTSGDVYVATTTSGGPVVEVFDPSGAFLSKAGGKETPLHAFASIAAVAVDEGTNDLYVLDGENQVIDQFNAKGEWIGWLPVANGEPFGEALGVAVSHTGEVLVIDNASPIAAGAPAVDVFGPNAVVPDATTEKASKIERTTAAANGAVNPHETEAGSPAKYFFEYGESTTYGAKTEELEAKGDALAKVSTVVTGLTAGTTYDYRLVARDGHGINYGANKEFTTPPAVAGLATEGAEEVAAGTPTEKVKGTLNGPAGVAKSANPEAKYLFEYGATTAYGSKSPEVTLPAEASGPFPAEATLSGLQANGVYHYRIVGIDSFGTSFGEDKTFRLAGPPAITSEPTTGAKHTQATVNAQINPDKRETKYFVEYGEASAYGASTAEASLPVGEAPVAVAANLSGLKLATTYHFRFVAKSSLGTVHGADQEFTTTLIESESVEEVAAESAVLQGQINPEGVKTTYHFEYGETSAYGTSVPATVEEEEKRALSGEGDTVVKVPIGGLHPSTTYHYRLVATVEGVGKGAGPDRTFTTPASGTPVFHLPDGRSYEMVTPPNKSGGYVEAINRNGGAIQASANGEALAYVSSGPLVEDAEGNRSPFAQQVLATHGTEEWHSQEIVGPNERAFGLRPLTPGEYQQFSTDLSLSAMQPFPFGLTPLAEPALSPPLTPAEREVVKEEGEPERLNQQKTIYLRADAPIAPTESTESAIYAEAAHNGAVLASEHGEASARPGYLPLVTDLNAPAGVKFGGEREATKHEGFPSQVVHPDLYFRDATPDLSHTVLTSGLVGLAKSGPSATGLYEWSANHLQLISVLPDGTPAPGGVPPGGARLGFENGAQGTNFRNAISRDGSRIFWSVKEGEPEGHEEGLGALYMRDSSKGETVRIDLPEAGITPAAIGRAVFQIASVDGLKVFFTDTARLTADSSARAQEKGQHIPAEPDLYECEIQEEAGKLKPCKLRDLTANPSESGGVQGFVQGASNDGSTIYFVADGALTTDATRGNCATVVQEPLHHGTCSLYVTHEAGGHWTTKLIGRISTEDSPDWLNPNYATRLLVNMPVRVSGNGRYLAFMSNQRLTGYDNTDVNETEAEAGEGKRHTDEEVFIYDAGAENAGPGALTCVSCNPTGARPNGVFDTEHTGEGLGLVVDRPLIWSAEQQGTRVNGGVDHWLAGNIPGWTPLTERASLYQSGYLSESGRLYFNSADPLVPQAAHVTRHETIGSEENASVGVENVYQYEPGGTGQCTTTPGCVDLLSSGTSAKESAFLDASASGNDVFFLTAAPLLARDQDTVFDIYDARACAATSGCQTPPPPAKEACKDASSCERGTTQQPGYGEPPTSSSATPSHTVITTPAGATLPNKTTKLSRSQLLARALKACRRLPHRTHAQRARRSRCEASAQHKYGVRHPKRRKR
jgi:hypothetical protein